MTKKKIGEAFKASEKIKESCNNLTDEQEVYQVAADRYMLKLRDTSKTLWEILNEHHPEIKDLRCSYNRKNHTITILPELD